MSEEAFKRLAREVEHFITVNRNNMNEEAIQLLKGMGVDDQRRVLSCGPMQVAKDLLALFQKRIAACIGRENEEASRKRVDVSTLVKEATEEEVKQWLNVNGHYLDAAAQAVFNAFSSQDKKRVISEGSLCEHVDPVHVVRTRAKRSRDLVKEVEALFAKKRAQATQPEGPEAFVPIVSPKIAEFIQEAYTSYVGKEVPASQRRCSGFGKAPEPEKPPLVGTVKGIGGVVEILKPKYGCQKGQRFTVIGETGGPFTGNWQLEGKKTIPKTHLKEGGWRWVIETSKPGDASPASPGEPRGSGAASPQATAAPQAESQSPDAAAPLAEATPPEKSPEEEKKEEDGPAAKEKKKKKKQDAEEEKKPLKEVKDAKKAKKKAESGEEEEEEKRPVKEGRKAKKKAETDDDEEERPRGKEGKKSRRKDESEEEVKPRKKARKKETSDEEEESHDRRKGKESKSRRRSPAKRKRSSSAESERSPAKRRRSRSRDDSPRHKRRKAKRRGSDSDS